MSDILTREEWEDLGKRLREPFKPEDVDFRIDGNPSEQTGKARVVAYADARAVQDRLDEVVGPGGWSFTWEPVTVKGEDVMVAKGTLTIYGISKSDAGGASNFEQSLGAVSHCLKRAAVHWGIGRYLYSVPAMWATPDKAGKSWRLSEAALRELRAKLPRSGQTTQTVKPRAEVVREEQQGQDAATTSQRPTRPVALVHPKADGEMTLQQFIDALKPLGISPRTAMGRLRVKSLSELHYPSALATLLDEGAEGEENHDLRQAFTGQART
jgi:hypothetical protein